ncbi:MAG: UDP-N-acetylmuramoyl-tripeptide--D-alanyl-D-alanine ligase [Hyphomicrobiaceae bacterium]|nr:UDP-N-acetylmuramoyl-tripeptide--D-alanyl-D-alanine ligase [Hyphomicrobiaceae bacterium]
MLFSIQELVAATAGEIRNADAEGITSIVIDSRNVPEGAMFVAIKGERHDGHDFAADAVDGSASLAMVSAGKAAGFGNLPMLVVPDPLKGLRQVARAARERSGARIVAVTGSVGKTSTKEALRAMFGGFGKVHASIKSYNNHWGVPLMLANLPKEADFGVFEIGMSAEGEITPLTRMVRPHVALVTSIAPAHLGELGSMAAIARAKSEIFLGLEAGGAAIINADHEFEGQLVDAARQAGARLILTYGFERGNVRIADYAPTAIGSRAAFTLDGEAFDLEIAGTGRHMMANAVGAALVALALDLPMPIAIQELAQFSAPDGRGIAVEYAKDGHVLTLLDESYNANPTSMRAALEVFAQRPAEGRRVLVLGDMLELGEQSAELHRGIVDAVAEGKPDHVVLVGPEMSQLLPLLEAKGIRAETRADVNAAGTDLVGQLDYGDLVMLKGSNGMGLSKLVTQIRHHFGQ